MVKQFFVAFLIVARTGAQEIPSDLEPILFMDAVHADLEAACPTGIDKCECMHAPGTFTNGPFNPREDPIGAMINFVGCAPGYCFCKDSPEKELDVRPQFFRAIQDLCPRHKLDRCLCKDGKLKTKAPFDVMKAYTCQPKKCKCKGSNKVKIQQEFGCPNGGLSSCPKLDDLYCKDGTHLSPNNVMQWRMKNARERWNAKKPRRFCACPDGIMPRCRETGKHVECPNGEDVDWNLGGAEELAGCRIEDW